MSRRRRPVELPFPNNLFAQWIEEWRVEAKKNGWKSHYNYEKALKSLKKYPLPLSSGQEAKCTLQYCGEKMAKMLDRRLASYQQPGLTEIPSCVGVSNGMDGPHRPPTKRTNVDGDDALRTGYEDPPRKKPKRVREYVPAFRSGPYAILIILYRAGQDPHYRGYMTKAELQSEAQTLCDASFTVPDPGSDYTAWASMSNLTQKGLVCKYSCPAKYSLTESGKTLAVKLETVNERKLGHGSPQTINSTHAEQRHVLHDVCHVDVSSDDDALEREPLTSRLGVYPRPSVPSVSTHGPARPSEHRTIQAENRTQEHGSKTDTVHTEDFVPLYSLLPGEFDIVLCIDYGEATGVTDRRIPIIQELRKNGVPCDMRKLQVGDFLWIAKERMKPVAGMLALPTGRELTLGHVIERKRLDDLSSSKKDGRFREQKFRLKESGLQHVIYLIEECYHRNPMSIPEDRLRQTIVNMQVLDGLQIKHTKCFNDTVAYLTIMTRMLTSVYKDKILIACPKTRLPHSIDMTAPTVKLLTFEEFSQSSLKNRVLTVREVFGKQLVQFEGVSAELAIEILQKFPTLDSLLRAYDTLTSEEEKRSLLADVRHGKTDMRLGAKLSNTIYQFYCRR